MGDFVGDHVGYPLELGARRPRRVDEESGLAERHAAQVLHGAEGEVGDGDQVELVGRIGKVEIGREEPQRVGRHLEAELGQVSLARCVNDAHRHTIDVDRRRRIERSHHESDQVGGHLHRGSEAHPSLAVDDRLVDHGRIREGGQVLVHDQGDLEDRLAIGLVPTRERPTGVRRLHLGRGDGVGQSRDVGEGAAVEPPQLVVELTGERTAQGGGTGGQALVEGEADAVLLGLEADRGVEHGPVGQLDGRDVERQLRGVGDDGLEVLVHDDVDGDVARERGRLEVRAKLEDIAHRLDRSREAERLVGGGGMLRGVGHLVRLSPVRVASSPVTAAPIALALSLVGPSQ